MSAYRLFFVEDGRPANSLPFTASDDTAAQTYVASQRFGRIAELWSLTRLVDRYPSDR